MLFRCMTIRAKNTRRRIKASFRGIGSGGIGLKCVQFFGLIPKEGLQTTSGVAAENLAKAE